MNKKIKYLLFTTLSSCVVPLTAVSCLYQGDKTIQYAKDWVQQNGFNIKQRVADKNIPTLVKFENNLYTANWLAYTYSDVDIRYQNLNVSINNSFLKTSLPTIITTAGKGVAFNQDNINFLANSILLMQYNFDQYNKKHKYQRQGQDLINSNIILLNDIHTKQKQILEKLDAYHKINGKRSVAQILVHKYGTNEAGDDIDLEKQILTLYQSLSKIEYYQIDDFNKVITEDKVKSIVYNFIKDTPLAVGINYVDYANKEQLEAFKPVNKLLTYNNADISFKIDFANNIRGNTIDTNLVNLTLQKNKILDSKIDYTKIDAKNTLKNIWNVFYKLYPNYRIETDESLPANLEDEIHGITRGFGPTYLIFGISPSATSDTKENKNDEYKVFSEKLSETEQSEFLSKPKEFIQNHIDMLYYKTYHSYINTLPETLETIKKTQENIEKLQQEIKQLQNDNDTKKLDEKISALKAAELFVKNTNKKVDVYKIVIDYFEKTLPAVKKASEALRNPNLNATTKAQATKTINDFLNFEVVKFDLDNIYKLIDKSFAESKTSQYSLADLFAKLLFLNKIYKTQSVLGYKINTDSKKLTYWVEFYNQEDKKWYLFDVYGYYKAIKKDKNSNIDTFIFDKLDNHFEKLPNSNSEL
ncbi:hypothetical protein ACXYRR_01095 [Mycoplasma sp. 246B]